MFAVRHLVKGALLVLAGLAAGQVRAQVFERGYVVTAAGDTLRGVIENRFWQAPPESVVFRPTPQGASRTYSRAQLRAFSAGAGPLFPGRTGASGPQRPNPDE
jgi:hypothetical protein